MGRAWNGWYHCNGNTYGTWLRGSDLGFRERRGRHEVQGDYKHPPRAERYAGVKSRSREAMLGKSVWLRDEKRQVVVTAFVASLATDQCDVVCVAMDKCHFHVLVRCKDGNPRKWVGRAKGRSVHALNKMGLVKGRVWAVRFKCTPVVGRKHQVAVARYIAAHGKRGAALWTCVVGRKEIKPRG